MAAFNTADAIRAAEFHLYYPEHLLVDGLKPWRVPLMMFYYAEGEANYWVDITEVIDLKAQAVSRHVSQFEPSITRYRPDWDPQVLKTFLEGVKSRATRREGRYVEGFRRATGFNPR
jgi:LmbE family N-acetylglucosaminyl deacetylase